MKNDTSKTMTTSTDVKEFHAVEFFRTVKEKIADETKGMNFDQLKQYLAQKLSQGSVTKLS